MVYKSLIFLLLVSVNIFASSNLENIKSYEAEFIQKITNVSGKTIDYKGEVFIKNSGKVLWKYATPVIKNVYLIDDLAIIDEPELEQAIYTRLEKSIDIIKLIKNAKKIDNKTYEATLYEVKYKISVDDSVIKAISYSDELENKIVISFEKIKQNQKIDDKIFVFFPPNYYDIIRN